MIVTPPKRSGASISGPATPAPSSRSELRAPPNEGSMVVGVEQAGVVPSVGFHGQPFHADETAGAVLASLLDDAEISKLTIVVAWARYRGLLRLRSQIQAFRARGGKVRVIVGIDEGGATRPGLLGVIELADEALVFHDPGGGTFHPKVYLAEGATTTALFVGSSNMTPGGLYVNVEASLEARFTLPDEHDDPALVSARAFVERLANDQDATRDLTAELVDEMVKSKRYRVAGNERRRPRTTTPAAPGAEPEDIEEVGSDDESGEDEPLFRRSTQSRATIPRLDSQDQADLAALEIDDGSDSAQGTAASGGGVGGLSRHGGGTGPTGGASSGAPSTAYAVESWTKTMSNSDAQRTSPPTNPTGVLRFSKARHTIDHRTWFRRQLFGSHVAWVAGTDSQNNPIEKATVAFDVEIDGSRRGKVTLEIDHAPHREEDQDNVTTILHWDDLADEMRATDHSGKAVTIERLDTGEFRLTIS